MSVAFKAMKACGSVGWLIDFSREECAQSTIFRRSVASNALLQINSSLITSLAMFSAARMFCAKPHQYDLATEMAGKLQAQCIFKALRNGERSKDTDLAFLSTNATTALKL